MATKSKRWTRADARIVVDEFEVSGLSIADFAKQRSLPYERIRKWRTRFRRETAAEGPRLVELVAHPPQPLVRLAVRCPSGHVIELADVELTAALRAVLAALPETGRC